MPLPLSALMLQAMLQIVIVTKVGIKTSKPPTQFAMSIKLKGGAAVMMMR